MRVRDYMSSQIVSAPPNTPILEVWNLIFKKHIHGLPIVDKRKRLVGIVSEEDLLTKLFPDYNDSIPDISATEGDEDAEIKLKLEKLQHFTAEKVMSRRVYYARPDTHIMRALSRMIIRKVRQLPVLDNEDKLVGMISKGDIFDGLFMQNMKRISPKKRNLN